PADRLTDMRLGPGHDWATSRSNPRRIAAATLGRRYVDHCPPATSGAQNESRTFMRARVLAGIFAASALVLTGCGGSDDGGGDGGSSEFSLVSSGSLTVCSDVPYEPFEMEKGGDYTGFDIDLMSEI